ncbi:MAG: 50S ribosomal protein L9 [Defluviitaleaceae bacterium]|nr:50S ribosomal protein L9 [Defluviitaleaceae bacterium]MCL2262993.1 50S ribosomal protein L9 [Defluviitaleaceae bacterium]
MQVILLEDVKGIGKKGQTVNAADGHALNFLIPRKLAVEANKTNLAQLDAQKKKAEKKLNEDIAAAKAIADKLKEAKIKIPVRVGENGKMFGSISNKEVAEAVQSQAGVAIDKKKFTMQAVKTVGEHTAAVNLHPQVKATLTFELVRE